MIDASDLGRALAALRPTATFACEVCGRAFEARAAGGQRAPTTCSPACRQKRYRQKRATTTSTTAAPPSP